MIVKDAIVRSKKLTDAAKNEPCVKCGNDEPGRVVLCHYQGISAHLLGKGIGRKPHDFAGSDLCGRCHLEFDRYIESNDYERAFEFLMLCMVTIARRFQQGVLVVK